MVLELCVNLMRAQAVQGQPNLFCFFLIKEDSTSVLLE